MDRCWKHDDQSKCLSPPPLFPVLFTVGSEQEVLGCRWCGSGRWCGTSSLSIDLEALNPYWVRIRVREPWGMCVPPGLKLALDHMTIPVLTGSQEVKRMLSSWAKPVMGKETTEWGDNRVLPPSPLLCPLWLPELEMLCLPFRRCHPMWYLRSEPKGSNDNRKGKNTAVWFPHLEKDQTEEVGNRRNSIPEDPWWDRCNPTQKIFWNRSKQAWFPNKQTQK